jgi:hypothetical protein
VAQLSVITGFDMIHREHLTTGQYIWQTHPDSCDLYGYVLMYRYQSDLQPILFQIGTSEKTHGHFGRLIRVLLRLMFIIGSLGGN